MKNRKGFTLIEILAVIIIIAVISLIVTPIITGTLKTSKDDLYETQLENIKSAAKSFMVDLDLEKGTTLNLTLEDLKKTGFLKKDIKNPKTGEKFANCTTVNVSRNDDVYDYEVVVSNDNSCSYDSEVSMILLGYNKVQILKNRQYIDEGLLLRTDRGKLLSLDDVQVEIKKEKNIVETMTDGYNNLSQLIDTTDYYKYEIIYKYTYNGKLISKTRIVEIVEDINLECMILPTTAVNEYGWITEERKAKIFSINTDRNVQYSLSTKNEKKYGASQVYNVPNDGVVTLYGYIKDDYGNEASCSNTIKYEVGNPSCNIKVTGTLGTNDWYRSDVNATLGITPISSVTGKGLTTSNVKSYNNKSSLTFSSTNTVYGYVKDEAGKEIKCSKTLKIDKVAPTKLNLSGLSATEDEYKTTKLTLTASATDTESGIYDYKFYTVSGSKESYLGNVVTTAGSTTYNVTNPAQGDSYKVIVTDKAGNESSTTLNESCSSSEGTCIGGSKMITVTCNTGYNYKYTSTEGCNTTTSYYPPNTSPSGPSSGGSTGGCSTSAGSYCSSCPTSNCNCYYRDANCNISYVGSCGCDDGVDAEAGVEADDEELPD